MAAQSDQLLFDLGNAPSLTRDDLVVSASNAAAIALVDSWPQWQAPWAILVGANGCGKTHLAEIWRSKAGALPFASSELSMAVEAAQSGHSILIDGLAKDFLDETALFHLLNAVRNANYHLLMTADTAPEKWGIKTPDLMSRLKATLSATIDEPDDALISAVIVKLFADRQIQIEMPVVDYMVLRVERSLAAVNALVDEIDRAALASKSKITKQFVGAIIKARETQ